MRSNLLLCLAVLLTGGCSALGSTPPASTPSFPVSASFTPIATFTKVVSPSATTPTPVQTFEPFFASTWADSVALRQGPGYLFLRIGLLPKDTTVTILGRSRGGEWALAQTRDGRVGWIFIQLVEADEGIWSTVPYSEPIGAQVITGVVKDTAGVPVSGIQFALTQGAGSLAPRTDAMTDSSGTFYAYLPADARGQWYLSYTAIACTSNMMDPKCAPRNGAGGRPYPEGQYVTLPLTGVGPLQFTWK